jgi:ATP-dependent helicase YprA (DUF1998 family)
MPNLVEVTYEQTGQSTNTDALGMREMQARAYTARNNAQHLLIKAPSASGKSRALMVLALDKMHNQGVRHPGHFHLQPTFTQRRALAR